MRAVNLLPPEQRRAGASVLSGLNPGTLALFGVLVVAVTLVAGYVGLANRADDRRAELALVQAQDTGTKQQIAALQPYAELARVRDATAEQVRTLASARYDWATALARVARALPRDVTLTTLEGAPGAEVAAATPAPAAGTTAPPTPTPAPAGPTVHLVGCTSTTTNVGRAMAALRDLAGVTDVTLASTTASGESEGCARPESFDLTVTLEGSPAPAAPAAATTTATGATP